MAPNEVIVRIPLDLKSAGRRCYWSQRVQFLYWLILMGLVVDIVVMCAGGLYVVGRLFGWWG